MLKVFVKIIQSLSDSTVKEKFLRLNSEVLMFLTYYVHATTTTLHYYDITGR